MSQVSAADPMLPTPFRVLAKRRETADTYTLTRASDTNRTGRDIVARTGEVLRGDDSQF